MKRYMQKIMTIQTAAKVIKISLGSCIAIMIASAAGLQYSASAGIITLLSIQDTKKATLQVAGKRAAAFLAALAAAYACFKLMGFTPAAFGVFLLLFVTVCIVMELQDGISMCAVLVTHFLVEQSMSVYWIRNELLLMMIGTGIGILLNMYIPGYVKQIRMHQQYIELEMRLLLKGSATYLRDREGRFQLAYDFGILDTKVDQALKQAYEERDNNLGTGYTYFIKYMEMRRSQIVVLKHMIGQLMMLKGHPVQRVRVAALIEDILLTFRESNNAVRLLESLNVMKMGFKEQPLPEHRQEFEDRAILYGIMNSLEQFLEFKKYFADDLTMEEKNTFWTG